VFFVLLLITISILNIFILSFLLGGDTIISSAAALAAASAIFAQLGRRPDRGLAIVIIFTLFNGLLGSAIWGATDGFNIVPWLTVKEIFLLILLINVVLRFPQRYEFFDCVLLAFSAVYCLSYVVSPAPNLTKLASMKECFVLVAAYFLGRHIVGIDARTAILQIGSYILRLSIIIAGFGLVFYFLATAETWRFLSVPEYFQAKFSNSVFWFLMDGYNTPPNFFTYIGGEQYSRLVAPLLDAPSLSRFLVVPIGLALVKVMHRMSDHRNSDAAIAALILFAMLLVTQFLTLGRAGMMMTGVMVIGLISTSGRRAVIMLPATLSIIAISTLVLANSFANNERHALGLTQGFKNITLVGHGVGTGGQLAANYVSGGMEDILALETYIGGLTYQLGVIGLLVFILIIFLSGRKTLAFWRAARQDSSITNLTCLMAWLSFTGLLFSAISGNSALTLASALLPCVLGGAAVTVKAKENKAVKASYASERKALADFSL